VLKVNVCFQYYYIAVVTSYQEPLHEKNCYLVLKIIIIYDPVWVGDPLYHQNTAVLMWRAICWKEACKNTAVLQFPVWLSDNGWKWYKEENLSHVL